MPNLIFVVQIYPHLPEQVCGKYEISESLVVRTVYLRHVADPFFVTFVEENDVFAYAEHGIHVVRVDYGGYAIFMGYVAEQFVNDYGCAWIKAGVRFVAKKIFRIQGYCPRYCHSFLHASGDFRRVFVVGTLEVYPFYAEQGTVSHLRFGHLGEHDQRKHHVAEHRLAVKQSRSLEKHADFLTQVFFLIVVHGKHVPAVEKYLSLLGSDKSND